MSLYVQDDYPSFRSWMADAHSLMSHIQHEIDLAELSGGGSEFIVVDAQSELVALTDAFGKLLEREREYRQREAA
ncbi:MAG: hypothetical protein K9K68_02220 [Methylococcaceae bacterium]|nr:hypothetical protein [Methylococcaceae bacterium]